MRNVIDWTKKLVLHTSTGPNERKVVVRSVLKNGGALVTLDQNPLAESLIFDEFGNYLGCAEGGQRGSALSIRMWEATPAKFLVEMTAEEAAFVRVLLGNSSGRVGYDLYSTLDDLSPIEWETARKICEETLSVKTDSDEFKALVASYERVGSKVHGEPFKITRNFK